MPEVIGLSAAMAGIRLRVGDSITYDIWCIGRVEKDRNGTVGNVTIVDVFLLSIEDNRRRPFFPELQFESIVAHNNCP